MQRFLRDIAAGAQTLRFLTALVVSTLVTTAIATPMAIKALDNPASRANAVVQVPPTGQAEAPATTTPAPPGTPSTSATAPAAPASPTTAAPPTSEPPATTAAPATTTAPTTTTAGSVTASVAFPNGTGVEVEGPAAVDSTTTTGAPPTTAAPPTTVAPTTTTTAGSGLDIFGPRTPCGPDAHELDEDSAAPCEPDGGG